MDPEPKQKHPVRGAPDVTVVETRYVRDDQGVAEAIREFVALGREWQARRHEGERDAEARKV